MNNVRVVRACSPRPRREFRRAKRRRERLRHHPRRTRDALRFARLRRQRRSQCREPLKEHPLRAGQARFAAPAALRPRRVAHPRGPHAAAAAAPGARAARRSPLGAPPGDAFFGEELGREAAGRQGAGRREEELPRGSSGEGFVAEAAGTRVRRLGKQGRVRLGKRSR